MKKLMITKLVLFYAKLPMSDGASHPGQTHTNSLFPPCLCNEWGLMEVLMPRFCFVMESLKV